MNLEGGLRAPWQNEADREGMVLLYDDRASTQYELAERLSERPELRCLAYLRDAAAAAEAAGGARGAAAAEAAEAVVEADRREVYLRLARESLADCCPERYFEYWLALLRQVPAVLPTIADGLTSPGLKTSTKALRAAMLARMLGHDARILEVGIRLAAGEAGTASSQFYGWGTLLLGLSDLGWSSEWAWERSERLAGECGHYYCQIYGALAVRLGEPDRARRFLAQAGEVPELWRYLEQGGKAPSLVSTVMRNFRHAYKGETSNRWVRDVLPVEE